jgi:hypothetical protein
MKWLFLSLVVAALAGASAFGQNMDHAARARDGMAMHHHGTPGAMGSTPMQPGQDAFGAVQEIIGILEADPATDWSKVNLDALRVHLIDMNEVALHAEAAVEHIEGGVRAVVTGAGRTLVAIQRMLPEHAHEMDGRDGWVMRAEPRPDGITLTVTAADPKQVARIQGLGFIGVMASGGHHQMHHLMIAKGAM